MEQNRKKFRFFFLLLNTNKLISSLQLQTVIIYPFSIYLQVATADVDYHFVEHCAMYKRLIN